MNEQIVSIVGITIASFFIIATIIAILVGKRNEKVLRCIQCNTRLTGIYYAYEEDIFCEECYREFIQWLETEGEVNFSYMVLTPKGKNYLTSDNE